MGDEVSLQPPSHWAVCGVGCTHREKGCLYLIHTKTSPGVAETLPSFWEFLKVHTKWKEQRSFYSILRTNYYFRMCFVPSLLCSVVAKAFQPAWAVFSSSLSHHRQPTKLISDLLFMKFSCHLVADTS